MVDIADRLLGDGIRWNEIRILNLDRQMADGEVIKPATDIVKPGWTLAVPVDARLPSGTEPSQLSEMDTVIVDSGDHFWAIAEQALVDAWGRQPTDAEITPYWVELVAANKDRLLPPEDPNLIYPSQAFLLPETPPSPDTGVDLNGSAVLNPPPVPAVSTEAPPRTPSEHRPDDLQPVESAEPAAPRTEVATPTAASEQHTPPDGEGALAGLTDDAKPIAAIASGLSLLGATLLFTLRRLRHMQAARRRPNATIEPPDDAAAAFEEQVRAISTDGEDVRYMAAVNSYLSHKLENAATPIPSIVAAMAGQFGLEFLLDDPCDPVEGFVASNDDNTAWRLRADIDAETMESAVNNDAHPFAPALCVAGSTSAGAVLLDLEQLAAVSVEGDPEQVDDFLRGLVAFACTAPWAEQCELVTIGLDGIGEEHHSRVTTPTEPVVWAEQLATKMSAFADNLDRSPYQERIAHGEAHHPTIVFLGPHESLAGITQHLAPVAQHLAPVAQHLAPVAQLAYAPLVVVSAHPLSSEYRISVTEHEAMLEPFGLGFVPEGLAAEELAALGRLIANASETSASPPATEWAHELGEADHLASNGHRDPSGPEVPDDHERRDNILEPEPSQATVDAIAMILQAKPVEVRILGRQASIDGLEGDASPKIKAIIAYMAYHREVVGQRLRDEFWPGSESRQACDNAMVKARSVLGLGAGGQQRLETVRATSSYRISDDVGLDWHRVEHLIAATKEQPPADEAAYLDAACELIDGHVAADAKTDLYGWLLNDPTTYTLIETTLVDAAHRRGQIALAMGDIERATWAAQKGLEIVEGQEAMYRMKMEAASEAGDIDGVNSAYRQARRAAESYGYDEEVQPETQALFEKLTRASRKVIGSDLAQS